jgi:hypothetical protein
MRTYNCSIDVKDSTGAGFIQLSADMSTNAVNEITSQINARLKYVRYGLQSVKNVTAAKILPFQLTKPAH